MGFPWSLILLTPILGCLQLDNGAVNERPGQFMTESFPFMNDCLSFLFALFENSSTCFTERQ